MFPFRRPKTPEPTVTNGAYQRWLRAQRPPWGVFFTLGEDEQEQLAMLGDGYVAEVAEHLGAVLGGAAPAAEQATESDLTANLIQQVAHQVMQRHGATSRPPAAPAGFGGHGGSRSTAVDDQVRAGRPESVEAALDDLLPRRDGP